MTNLILTHYKYIGFEPTAAPIPWKTDVDMPKSLCFGLLKTDGCVTPQPPIARALSETAEALKKAGHTGTELFNNGIMTGSIIDLA